MKAIGYVRVSTEDQAREGVSLDNQKEKIRAYCQLKDMHLEEIIEDAGISAKNLNRPGVKRALDMSRRGEVDAIVVYKLDRLFRSTVDALETTTRFDKWSVSFHSINESLDTQSAMGKFFFTLTAALAEMERGIVSERTKAALSHKRAQGEKTGGSVPFGYDSNVNGLLSANTDEQNTINRIQRFKENGCSLRDICSRLESEKLKTKTGNLKWNPKTISAILKRVA